MRFRVCHETVYRYSVPVELGPHVIRLTPRLDGLLGLISHVLDVQPRPVARFDYADQFGNRVAKFDFAGATSALQVVSQFEVETFLPAPLAPVGPPLPWRSDMNDGLEHYRVEPDLDPAVQRFASELASYAGGAPLAFLDRLCERLFTRTSQQMRLSGPAQFAQTTLASGQGSCRDLTVLFLAACRSLGMAGRFTSGYAAPRGVAGAPRELHAWPEIFLPAIGWRGWDPSSDQRVLDGHVALCAAPMPATTLPVEGGYAFSGSIVTTTLDYDVRISTHN